MLELSTEFAAIARRNIDSAGVGDRAEIRSGRPKQSLKAIPAEPAFDFAFVNADRGDDPEYYELVLARLRAHPA
jgi:caffeoyl-CoA O-methyltransferase